MKSAIKPVKSRVYEDWGNINNYQQNKTNAKIKDPRNAEKPSVFNASWVFLCFVVTHKTS